MAKSVKTTKKRQPPANGVKFSKDRQPPPENKSKGWEHWRKERLLSQAIVKKMFGANGKPTKTMSEFVTKLVKNANDGNPKAIDVLVKSMEDQEAIKVALNIPLLSFDPLSQSDDKTDNGTP